MDGPLPPLRERKRALWDQLRPTLPDAAATTAEVERRFTARRSAFDSLTGSGMPAPQAIQRIEAGEFDGPHAAAGTSASDGGTSGPGVIAARMFEAYTHPEDSRIGGLMHVPGDVVRGVAGFVGSTLLAAGAGASATGTSAAEILNRSHGIATPEPSTRTEDAVAPATSLVTMGRDLINQINPGPNAGNLLYDRLTGEHTSEEWIAEHAPAIVEGLRPGNQARAVGNALAMTGLMGTDAAAELRPSVDAAGNLHPATNFPAGTEGIGTRLATIPGTAARVGAALRDRAVLATVPEPSLTPETSAPPSAAPLPGLRRKIAEAVYPEARRAAAVDPRTGLGSRVIWEGPDPIKHPELGVRGQLDADPNTHIASADLKGLKPMNEKGSPTEADAVIARAGAAAHQAALDVGLHPQTQVFSPKGDEFYAAGTLPQVTAWNQRFKELFPDQSVTFKNGAELPTGVRGGVGRTVEEADLAMQDAKNAEKNPSPEAGHTATAVADQARFADLRDKAGPESALPGLGEEGAVGKRGKKGPPSIADLQAQADAQGIKVRAAGMTETPFPMPSDPHVNLRLVPDKGLDDFQQNLDRIFNDPASMAQLKEMPEYHGKLLADQQALTQVRRERMRVLPPSEFADQFFGSHTPTGEEGMIGTFGIRSRLPGSIAAAKFDKAPAQTWVSKLRGNGNAASEFDWVVGEALRRDPTRVWTKAQLLDLAKGKGIKVTERVLGGARTVRPSPTMKGTWEVVNADGSVDSRYGRQDEARAVAEGTTSPTKFASYQEPGGTNYREVLVKLGEPPRQTVDDIAREMGHEGYSRDMPDHDEVMRRVAANALARPDEFESPHWDDPNVLVHLRMNDRIGPNGEKVLHVEEVQSDWMQKGRKEGFNTATSAVPTTARRNGWGAWEVSDANGRFITNVATEHGPAPDFTVQEYPTEADALAEARRRIANGEHGRLGMHGAVPDAPGMFKETPQWTLLGLKRALDEAVAGGYDRMSWTSGEQQAARYDLSKQVDVIHYEPASNHLIAMQDGRVVHSGRYDPKALASVIGKDAAERLLAAPLVEQGEGKVVGAGTRLQSISGPDLKVGGEGMKGYYDKILPETLKAYGKKLGVKLDVETATSPRPREVFHIIEKYGHPDDSPAGTYESRAQAEAALEHGAWDPEDMTIMSSHDLKEGDAVTTPSIRITPELRAKIKGGQELGAGGLRILAGTAGGLGGAAYGYATGKTPEDRRKRALLYGALGLSAGVWGGGMVEEAGRGRALERSLASTTPEFEALSRQTSHLATVPETFRTPPPPSDPSEFANLGSFALDPTGEQRLATELQRLGPTTKRYVSNAETRAAAQSLGLDDVTSADTRKIDGAQLLAVRNLVARNIDQIQALTLEQATTPSGPRQETLTRSLRALDVQNDALLRKFIRGRGDAGRRLQNLKLLANRTNDPVLWLAKATDLTNRPLAEVERETILRFLNQGDRPGLVRYLAGLRPSSLREKVGSYYRANLLTLPVTHAVNIASNVALLGLEQAKDLPAAAIDRLMGLATEQRTVTAPNVARLRALVDGSKRGAQEAVQVLRGIPLDEALQKWDVPQQTNFRNPILHAYTNGVFRLLSAEDLVFKAAALRGSLQSQAEALAMNEGLSGALKDRRAAELLQVPTDEMSLRALADAEEATVQDRTKVGQALGAVARALPGGEFVLPFTRTPGAVATRVGEYSPFGLAAGGARVLGVVRDALRNIDVNPTLEARQLTDGERQREAAKLTGRGATGTALYALGAYLAARGLMTGSSGLPGSTTRQTNELVGRPSGAVKVGTRWVDVSRIGVAGNLLQAGADFYHIVSNPTLSPMEKGLQGAGKMAESVLNQPFLQGVQNAIEAAQDPTQIGRMGEDVATGMVPAASLVSGVARAVDDTVRAPRGIRQAVASRLPVVSRSVPAALDQFGEGRVRLGGPIQGIVSPVRVSPDPTLTDPVLREIAATGAQLRRFQQKPTETPEQFRQRAAYLGTQRRKSLAWAIQQPFYTSADTAERKLILEYYDKQAKSP